MKERLDYRRLKRYNEMNLYFEKKRNKMCDFGRILDFCCEKGY